MFRSISRRSPFDIKLWKGYDMLKKSCAVKYIHYKKTINRYYCQKELPSK